MDHDRDGDTLGLANQGFGTPNPVIKIGLKTGSGPFGRPFLALAVRFRSML